MSTVERGLLLTLAPAIFGLKLTTPPHRPDCAGQQEGPHRPAAPAACRPQRRRAQQAPGFGHHRLRRCAPEHPRDAPPEEVDDQGLGLSAKKWSCDHQHPHLHTGFYKNHPVPRSTRDGGCPRRAPRRRPRPRDPCGLATGACGARSSPVSFAAFPVGLVLLLPRLPNPVATLLFKTDILAPSELRSSVLRRAENTPATP